MEENKKETNQEHVKIYDKEMYTSQEKLKTIVFIIIAFLIGFVAGYFSKDVINAENGIYTNNSSYTNTINE